MTHGAGLDPHFFDWPTLVMYAVAPFQAWQAAPSYLAGRFVVVAFAVGGIAAAWWLGSRSYGTVAGAIAAAATAVDVTHVTFSHAAVTDVPLTTLVTVALALLVTGRFELAGLAIGLATAAKYPGALTLVPLVVVAWGRWRRLAVSALLAAVAFFAASPFVVLDAGSTWSALRRIQEEHRRGWLGFEHDHWSGVAFAGHLWNGLGPVLVIAVVSLVARARRAAPLAPTSCSAPSSSPTSRRCCRCTRTSRATCSRSCPLWARSRDGSARSRLSRCSCSSCPLTWSVQRDSKLTRTDTRIVAKRWLAAHVPEGETIAAESSTAVPPGHPVVPIPLPLPGKDARVDLDGARWILVSGAVADRVLAAQDVYPLRVRPSTPSSPDQRSGLTLAMECLAHGWRSTNVEARRPVRRPRARALRPRERRGARRRAPDRRQGVRRRVLRARREPAGADRLRLPARDHHLHGDAPDGAGDQAHAEGSRLPRGRASPSATSSATTRGPPERGAQRAAAPTPARPRAWRTWSA